MSLRSATPRAASPRPLALCASLGLLCLAAAAPAAGAATWTTPGVIRPSASATLEQCLSAGPQAERAATFAGEMASVPGGTRMEMRVDVAERLPHEASYHTLSAPGLGVWRSSVAGVKVYRYLRQVTNLAGPAFYRGVVRFRWLGSHGRLLAVATLQTKRCEQPFTSPATSGSGILAAPAPGG
jgi:hypothetical protein